jgi:hypothetical protein
MHNPSPVVALATTQGYLLLIYTIRRCLPEKDKTSGTWPSQVLVTAIFATSLAVCNVLRESSYFLGAAMGRVDFGIGVVGALLLAHGAVSTVLCTPRFPFVFVELDGLLSLFHHEERFTRAFVRFGFRRGDPRNE